MNGIRVISITPTGHWRNDKAALRAKLAITKYGAYALGDGRIFTIGAGTHYPSMDTLLSSSVPDDPANKSKRAVIVDVDNMVPISPDNEHTNPGVLTHETAAIYQVASRMSIAESGEADDKTDKMLALYRMIIMGGLMGGLIFAGIAAYQAMFA